MEIAAIRSNDSLPQRNGFRFLAIMQDDTHKDARMAWCASRGKFVTTQPQMIGWLPVELRGMLR